MFIVRIIRKRRQQRAVARHFREIAQIKSERILNKLVTDGIITVVEES